MKGSEQVDVMVVWIVFACIYWLLMLIDSIRRPPALYNFGSKGWWVAGLILAIFIPVDPPLTNKLVPLAAVAGFYHLVVYRGNRIPRKGGKSKSEAA